MPVTMERLMRTGSILLVLVVLTVESLGTTALNFRGGESGVIDYCNRPLPCVPSTMVLDPYSSSSYWECLDSGKWIRRRCPKGDVFDARGRACLPDAVTSHPQPCDCQPSESCQVGLRLPNPYDCHSFYLCEHDVTGASRAARLRPLQCPNGTKFDLGALTCVVDSPAVVCHPPCTPSPCAPLRGSCPARDVKMAAVDRPTSYYKCSKRGGPWELLQCRVGEAFDFRTRMCLVGGDSHPGCPFPTALVQTEVTTSTAHREQLRPPSSPAEQLVPRVWSRSLDQLTAALQGGRVVLRCRVDLSAGRWRSAAVKWFILFDEIHTRGRHNVTLHVIWNADGDNCSIVSYLTISRLRPTDSGKLTCMFSLRPEDGITLLLQHQLVVLPRPTVVLLRMSATVAIGDELENACTAKVDVTQTWSRDRVTIEWLKNGATLISSPTEVISSRSDHESRLTLSDIRSNNTYGCRARNAAGTSQLRQCDVTAVRRGSLLCPSETSSSILWSPTAQGKMDRQLCPGNSTGVATRACGKMAVWKEPNLNNCVEPNFQRIIEKITRLQDGLGIDADAAFTSVAESLALCTAIPEANRTDPEFIQPGNLNVSISALRDLTDLHQLEDATEVSNEEVKFVVQIASNLLSVNNVNSWMSVLKDDNLAVLKIMQSLEECTRYASRLLDTDQPEKLTYDVDNLVLTVETWEAGSITLPGGGVDRTAEDRVDTVLLSNSTLSEIATVLGKKRLVVSSVYFRTLHSMFMFHSTNHSLERGDNSLVSRILSVAVDNFSGGPTLQNPIQLQFGNRKMVNPRDSRICSFLNYTSTGDTILDGGFWSSDGCRLLSAGVNTTTCECDHMTNFAILVSRYRLEAGLHKELSILTTIGLSLSTISLLTTIIIYITLWNSIKSDYALILINLCGALCAANVIFLMGIEQTESQVVCGIVAVLLHYLYLAAFFLMLTESFELLLYIIYVFHVHTNRETCLLLATAWGTPCIIIAICLCATAGEGYGNETFCWLSVETGLIWAFVGPMLAVILANFPILVIVIKKIYDSGELRRENKAGRIRSALWNMMVLAPLLGTTWSLGLLSLNKATVVFQYIFTLLNAFQGLFIFIFHCLCNKRLRDAFLERFSADSSSNNVTSTTGSKSHRQMRKSSSSTTAGKHVAPEEPDMATGTNEPNHSNSGTNSNPAHSPHVTGCDVTGTPSTGELAATRDGGAPRFSAAKPDVAQTLPGDLRTDVREGPVTQGGEDRLAGDGVGFVLVATQHECGNTMV